MKRIDPELSTPWQANSFPLQDTCKAEEIVRIVLQVLQSNFRRQKLAKMGIQAL